MTMQVGQRVRVQGYGGQVLERLVLEEREQSVVVCREEEFEAARREGREPRGVGFQKRFVLGVMPC